jgi:FKBP-type peptidyl-prolyl cis-trans isomerase
MHRYLFLIIGFFSFCLLQGQKVYNIPGYTAYIVPNEKEEDILFNKKDSSLLWNDPHQKIEFYFNSRKQDSLNINLFAKSKRDNKITIETNGEKYDLMIPHSKSYQLISGPKVNYTSSGFHRITLSVDYPIKKVYTNIQSLQLISNDEDIQFNKKFRRNAASVHLRYPLNDTNKVIQFYNEITVPKLFDPVHSYYMACGFARGYFGIQINSENERRVIFSVWDAGNEPVDRNKVADSNKVQLLAKGEDVIAEGFGNEGTGGHSHWVYPWNTDSTYKFLVTIIPDSIKHTTIYTGYIYLPEFKNWKLIASFKAPRDGHYLNHLYSFNENFVGVNGQLMRKALFGNQWVQLNNGKWVELTEAQFTGDATAKAFDRTDIASGVEANKFFLINGGFENTVSKLGITYIRTATKQRPVVDVTKNIDSAVRFKNEIAEIYKAVADKKIDTTGSVNGLYYQILKEGNGENVLATDTVIVYYKGSLLSDGSVFDQTKEDKPVTFPLSRLIKGWAIGLSKCKEGGKIRLIIPSALGYSIRSRSPAIPPNSILVFDIEVLKTKHS